MDNLRMLRMARCRGTLKRSLRRPHTHPPPLIQPQWFPQELRRQVQPDTHRRSALASEKLQKLQGSSLRLPKERRSPLALEDFSWLVSLAPRWAMYLVAIVGATLVVVIWEVVKWLLEESLVVVNMLAENMEAESMEAEKLGVVIVLVAASNQSQLRVV